MSPASEHARRTGTSEERRRRCAPPSGPRTSWSGRADLRFVSWSTSWSPSCAWEAAEPWRLNRNARQGVRARNNRQAGYGAGGVVCGMVGLAFASVPLYRLFCQVTGFGGTTQVAAECRAGRGRSASSSPCASTPTSTATCPGLPGRGRGVRSRSASRAWPSTEAENLSTRPITGTATFNVTPLKAGQYFSKVQCFCFEEQRLRARRERRARRLLLRRSGDRRGSNLDEVTTITLSYTFFTMRPRRKRTRGAAGGRGRQPSGGRRRKAGRPGELTEARGYRVAPLRGE